MARQLPAKFETRLYPANTTHGPDHQWLYLTFPESIGFPDEISIEFESGAVRKDGVFLSLDPFRFTKMEKADLYLASINC
jgi:hypothetical protein